MLVLTFEGIESRFPYHAALVSLRAGAHGAVGRMHAHSDFAEVMYVAGGTGHHEVNGRSQVITPGDVVLVRPTDRHRVRPSIGQTLEFINVAVPTDLLFGLLRVATIDFQRIFAPADPPHFKSPELVDLLPAFQTALTAYQRGPSPLDALRLLCDVLEPTLEGTADQRDGRLPIWLHDAMQFMRRQGNLREGLSAFRELTNVTPTHLSRTFRRYLDMTPVEWMNQRRLEHAAALLATSLLAIGEIAYRCGFESNSYFGKQFREAYGRTPRDYRRQLYLGVIGAETSRRDEPDGFD